MTEQPTQKHRNTIEDLIAMPDDDRRYELIDGKIVEMDLSSLKHSVLGAHLTWLIATYVRANKLGGIVFPANCTYRLNDENARVPDVSYITAESRAKLVSGAVFVPFAPDFAIVIKSPSRSTVETSHLARQYLQTGARLVWIMDYEDESILVYRSGQLPVQFSDEDLLDTDDVLPGFTVKPSDIFAEFADI